MYGITEEQNWVHAKEFGWRGENKTRIKRVEAERITGERQAHKRRTTGEQNKVYCTTMYVRSVQAQHTKGVRRFVTAQTGLDKACYGVGAVLRP
jgi:hypothetical protein